MSKTLNEKTAAPETSRAAVRNLQNYIGGHWVSSTAVDHRDVMNPARGEVIARVPLSTREDVNEAVRSAREAFPKWRTVPVTERARCMFRFKELLEKNFDELARIVTTEHGKTLDESRGSVRRGIECVEVACGMPSLMMGYGLEDIAPGIDCEMVRQPIGVFAAIAPFNFPAMVPLWFLPFAVATGNSFILKPSEQVPLSQQRICELLQQCGLPPGVVNLVNGAKEVVETLCSHPEINGISFVGSTPVARRVYQLAASHGKRVQALGGAKNFIVVMPDADLERSLPVVSESIYGCAGQRCLAGSVVVTVGKKHGEILERFVDVARSIRVGDGLEPGVKMGPVVSDAHQQRVLGYIEAGVEEKARLVLDGRQVKVTDRPNGYFIGPTVFDGVRPDMKVGREEIFGPVASVTNVQDLNEALALAHSHPNANAISIFTTSGKAAREFRYHAPAAMVGVNIGVAAPMAFFPFGGSKDSFFGDLKAHGRDGVDFYTEKKVTISRWL